MLESCNHDQSPWTYPETIRFCNDFTYLKISYSISKQPKRSFIVSLLPCYFLLLSKYISTFWNVLFAFSSGFLIFLYLAWPFPKPVVVVFAWKPFAGMPLAIVRVIMQFGQSLPTLFLHRTCSILIVSVLRTTFLSRHFLSRVLWMAMREYHMEEI